MAKTHSTVQATRAQWFRRIRQARKLTQKQLAKKVGVTTNAISQYERGQADPSIDRLDRLLIGLECWYIDLLETADAAPPPRRPMRRPAGDLFARSIDVVINEFAHPNQKPEQYPDNMRCWICHGRPGECHCYYICKVCGLPVRIGHKCSGVLH